MSDKKSETESVELTTPLSIPPVLWTDDHENILVEWADKALCYKWLHSKSHINYSRANAWYTIPVIILSTLTGTANFAQERFGDDIKPYIAMIVGALNIFAGILTTISQYLKIGELNEAHRVSSISWDKFYRNIKVELAKAPPERIEVFFWSCLGLYAMAGLLQWHLETKINAVIAAALVISAALLMWTPFPIYYHIAGATLLLTIVIFQKRSSTIAPAPGT